MLTKTRIVLVASLLVGFASSAMAASRHHEQLPAAQSTNTHDATGYVGWPDSNCTSCNLGSY
jgi:hypothetical protein